MTAGTALITMLAVSWQTVSANSATNQLLPARLTSVLLIGSLVPAMALIVLAGRCPGPRGAQWPGHQRAAACASSGCSR
jgi:two-component system nitrogen regulation sensor histidine kinase NtrY